MLAVARASRSTLSRRAAARCCAWRRWAYLTGALDLTAGDMGTGGRRSCGWKRPRGSGASAAADVARESADADARLENSIPLRMTLMGVMRRLRPKVLILPYWEARHPDHYVTSTLGFEAAFSVGHPQDGRSLGRAAPPAQGGVRIDVRQRDAFVRGGHALFDRRMESLFAYDSQYAEVEKGAKLFPKKDEIMTGSARLRGSTAI